MKSIEERLWDYIDGTCTADERVAIALLIAQNDEWAKKHKELTAFNNEISAIEPDEPPMGFAFKVMEHIRTDEARTPLKTAVSPYFVKGIAGFFILAIITVLIFLLLNINLIFGNSTVDITIQVKNVITNSVIVKIFCYLDIMLVLFFVDTLFRKKLRRVNA